MSISYRKYVWYLDIGKEVGIVCLIILLLDIFEVISGPAGMIAIVFMVAIGLSGAAIAALQGLGFLTLTCPACGGKTRPVIYAIYKRFPQALETLVVRRADITGNQCEACGSVCRAKIFGFGMVCRKPPQSSDPQTQV
ncbi:MAG TPA: hypothetical protein VM186_12490 [Planctomycetota bacterium]|nr:hypothetical protein [Planctomycetota bacterium]